MVLSDLLGAVPVLTNAYVPKKTMPSTSVVYHTQTRWLPLEPLRHCLLHTDCKLILLDSERADRLAPAVSHLLRDTPVTGFLVFDDQNNGRVWQGMSSFHTALQNYRGGIADVLAVDPNITPEDNAVIMFTSGILSQ